MRRAERVKEVDGVIVSVGSRFRKPKPESSEADTEERKAMRERAEALRRAKREKKR